MNELLTWGEVITNSFQNLWFKMVNFLPNIVSALIVLIIGLFIAKFFAKFITRTLKYLYLDKAIESLGLKEWLEKTGIKIDVSKIVGIIVKWFFIIVFLVAAGDILKFTQITEFLNKVLLYIPNVVIAVVILVLGVIFANFIHGLVKTSVHVVQLESANIIASVAKWSILVFTFMAAFVQLKIAAELVSVLFKGFVAMLALAGGISFGLGGQNHAKKIIEKLGEKK
ncbi:MAG: hypothetical protein V1655_01185 [bacterium]